MRQSANARVGLLVPIRDVVCTSEPLSAPLRNSELALCDPVAIDVTHHIDLLERACRTAEVFRRWLEAVRPDLLDQLGR